MRVTALDYLAVELQNQPQYAMGGGVLGPEVKLEILDVPPGGVIRRPDFRPNALVCHGAASPKRLRCLSIPRPADRLPERQSTGGRRHPMPRPEARWTRVDFGLTRT